MPVIPCRIDVAGALDDNPTADVFADLGCGDGRVLRRTAASIGCRCVGYEINTARAADAVAAVEAAGLEVHVTIELSVLVCLL